MDAFNVRLSCAFFHVSCHLVCIFLSFSYSLCFGLYACLFICLSVLPISVIFVYIHLSHSSLPLLSLFLSLSVHLLFYFPLSRSFSLAWSYKRILLADSHTQDAIVNSIGKPQAHTWAENST